MINYDGPYVLDVQVPYQEHVLPMIPSGHTVDDIILGFSGSSPSQYAAAYLAGRRSSDPVGELSDPILLKQGNAAYNTTGAGGVNRWGDYSLSSIDPDDDLDAVGSADLRVTVPAEED